MAILSLAYLGHLVRLIRERCAALSRYRLVIMIFDQKMPLLVFIVNIEYSVVQQTTYPKIIKNWPNEEQAGNDTSSENSKYFK